MSDDLNISDNAAVSGPVLGEWLGVSATRVQQLAKVGHVTKQGRGRYLLKDSIRRYTSFLRESSQGHQKSENSADYESERAGLYKQKRIRAEAENQLFLGQLHKADHVEKLWNDQIRNALSRLRPMKTKLAQLVQFETKIPVIEEIIGDEIDSALEEISEYDQRKFIDETISEIGVSVETASQMDN